MVKYRINKSKCAGCGACLRACPYGAILMGEDGKAFIDQNKCKKCGTCQEICPFDAIEKISEDLNKKKTKQSELPVSLTSTEISQESLIAQRRGLATRKGLGRGMGKGSGRRSRDKRRGNRGSGRQH